MRPVPAYLFLAWSNMFRRCYYVDDPAYHHYGGRGLTVCKRWQSIKTFCRDMGERPTPKHSLDRIDNDKGYSPRNCRWATQSEQMMNTRATRHWLTQGGQTLGLRGWAARTGININTLRKRVASGWPDDLILSTTTARPHARVQQRNVQHLLKPGGISHTGLYYRLKKGWTLEQALHTPRFQKIPVSPSAKKT